MNSAEEETLATWQTSLWLNNDESLYLATRNKSASQIEQFCKEMWGNTTPEGESLLDVDWHSVEEDCQE